MTERKDSTNTGERSNDSFSASMGYGDLKDSILEEGEYLVDDENVVE